MNIYYQNWTEGKLKCAAWFEQIYNKHYIAVFVLQLIMKAKRLFLFENFYLKHLKIKLRERKKNNGQNFSTSVEEYI